MARILANSRLEDADLEVALGLAAHVGQELLHLGRGLVQAHHRLVGVHVEAVVLRELAQGAFAPVDARQHRLGGLAGAVEGRCHLVHLLRDGVHALHGLLQLGPRGRLLQALRGRAQGLREGQQLAALVAHRGPQVLQQLLELGGPRLDALDRGVGQQRLHPTDGLVRGSRQLVDLVERAGSDASGDDFAAAQQLVRLAGHHVGRHAAEQPLALDLHPRVLGDAVFALDLQAQGHLVLVDVEALHPADVDPAHQHGVAFADARGVRHHGGHDIAPAEHGGVGEGEERDHDGRDARDHEEAHHDLAVEATLYRGGGELVVGHFSSMILRAAASAAVRSAKAWTRGSRLFLNSSGVPTKRSLPWSSRATRSEMSRAPTMS